MRHQLSADDIEFARLYGTNPIAVEQLRDAIIPGSIAERQFAEIWERRLPAPVLMIVNDRCDDATEFVSATELARCGCRGSQRRHSRLETRSNGQELKTCEARVAC